MGMITGLNIAIAQINPILGDVDGNARLIHKAIETSAGADLLVFPELVVCGYPPEDLILKPSFVQDCMRTAQNIIAAHKNGPALVLTTPWTENGKVYNAALFAVNGKIESIIYKRDLPNYGVFDEKRVFDSGPLPEPVSFKGHSLGILICEDIWTPEAALHLKQRGATCLLSPNGSPYDVTKRKRRLEHARARVKETGLPLVYVNQVGGQDDLVFDGGSFALHSSGDITFQAPYCESYVGPIQNPPAIQAQNEDEAIYNVLKLGLADYVRKNKFSGVLIGLSGGIDSALSAAIAVDALGAKNVRCVMMPSPFTSQESLEDAKSCADALGCVYDIIPITPIMTAFETTLSPLTGLAHENMQSRVRGAVLMSLSNQTGMMVLTTGNKSEMAVGYATLYGDMCGGFNVLKDIYKTDVYALAHMRNIKSLVIPSRILTKAPTAELRENQTDQDSLPPYDLLDTLLKGLIEEDLGVDDLIKHGFDAGMVKRVSKLLDVAEYKRRQSAPGVKITLRAFGRERRYPITNGYCKPIEKQD